MDVVCCKMTLEHIAETGAFMQAVGKLASVERGTIVFFQIPDARRILEEVAFWDVYYEHCSYFTPLSLKRLFRSAGFDVLRVWTGYDDQYLMIEARPAASRFALGAGDSEDERGEMAWIADRVAGFTRAVEAAGSAWTRKIRAEAAKGRRT